MDSPASETVDVRTTGSGNQPSQYGSPQLEDSPELADQNSPSNEDDADQPQKPTIAPMQKRRRVTRACDECRRKKIKCDGKQPCTHCTVYSYECTYDQPSNRRRNAAPQYIEALETQLKRAKTLLAIVFPTLDLNDPALDAHLQNGLLPQLPMGGPRPQQIPLDPRMQLRREDQARTDIGDSHLESMVKATGQLDLDEDGNWDYHGHSSGLSFMRRLQQQFGDVMPTPSSAASSPFAKYRPMSQVFDSPNSNHQSPGAESTSNALPAGTDLPSKKEARILCDNALIDAGALLRVVHIPSFYKSMDRIYETTPENYGNAENTFLPLLYAVLALGTLFSKRGADVDEVGYEASIDEGFKYFRASRQLLDIADCRDLTSLQAIIFMIQFLQSSAKLSTCYAYIGVALRSALRMGLHRSFNVNFNPIEAEIRKRLFWTIRKMDIYVGAMLGLPSFISDEDIDQEWPAEVDDEYITETEIRPMPEGKISVVAASNAHTKIVEILAKICRYVYPIKGTQSGGNNSVTYSVSYSKIREIEQDLQRWLEALPMALRPGGEAPSIIIRVQQLLRMAYGHAQLLLYRPFLHYVSQSFTSKPVDQRAFACANACTSVSRNIIHITVEMKRSGLLIGAYWFSMYTTFFAIISILYFVLENPSSPTSHELLKEAMEGKETIFERLPEAVKQGGEAIGSKKRRQGSSPQSLQSRPNLLKQDDFIAGGIRRASTFPETMPSSKRTTALPISHAHLANLGMEPTYGHSPSQSSSDFFDPAPSLTPSSSTTSGIGGFGIAPTHTPQQRQSFPATPMGNSFVDPSGINVPLSDVNAMMFPSADPFAYPNQPMTTFENNHPHEFRVKQDASPRVAGLPYDVPVMKSHPAGYSPAALAGLSMGPRRPNEDVQLFGPMPMYLMHGAQLQGQRGFHPPQPPQPQNVQMTGTPEGGNMNFDDLFGGEEWASTFMDQSMGLNAGGTGYAGGNSRFVPGGPNWPR
ncbi:hypothetical protein BU24DRAFT_340202 [Aaosphaeria arxii CBS 175.79]|uniref:Zn(2)-C6 fungal-type domain-containing protein n=1 Tax=Aaosphaeria arxii CBS 175.79 TaxID=1450172 RepID=A0A6A5Y6J4_9PLEO|nr:uncharacterized protein BU24DRAFT_340202 [Aaosphaeria arxii CBS 175.79]KAF2020637.1 hypothetical protein BU24DRAFT_340202 [Aaosphaeria arxii CBS 175.79]